MVSQQCAQLDFSWDVFARTVQYMPHLLSVSKEILTTVLYHSVQYEMFIVQKVESLVFGSFFSYTNIENGFCA